MTMIIAEIGSIHDGSFGNALKAIDAAASCGADIVKFQTHIASAETLKDAPSPAYFTTESRIDYFNRTSFTRRQWSELVSHARASGVDFMSSPFSLEAVDLLEDVGIDFYKIPSGEVTNLPLLSKIASTGKKIFLSTGMSGWEDIDRAMLILSGVKNITLMQCSSIYPCPLEHVGLNVMQEMMVKYGVPVGLSDHTVGLVAGVAAASLGATVVEKHFTFSRLMYGSDAKNGMEPNEFREYCKYVKDAAYIRQNPVNKNNLEMYLDMKKVFEKSIVSNTDLCQGHVIEEVDLAYKKPGDGISAALYLEIVGRVLKKNIKSDHKFSWEDFE